MKYLMRSIIFIIIFTELGIHSYSDSELNLDEIAAYIDDTLTLLIGKNRPQDPFIDENINTIKEQIISSVTKPTTWERITKKNIERTHETINKEIVTSISNFVEAQSYTYAYEKTKNPDISQKVSQNMVDAVNSRIIQLEKFKPGTLACFIGKTLQKNTEEQCNWFSAIHDTSSVRIIQCRKCRETVFETECITLSPCKHVICKNCAHEIIDEKPGIARCPCCSKMIDRKDNNL